MDKVKKGKKLPKPKNKQEKKDSADKELDDALKETFPASDSITKY